jgi:hypothetical protein
MAAMTRDQRTAAAITGVVCAALLGLTGVVMFARPSGDDVNAPEIRLTGYWVALAWAGVWPFSRISPRYPAGPLSWADRVRLGKFGRFAYTLACLGCLFHIAIAFHLGHGWSHRAAFEHTEQLSGFGPGIYVNYLFALVWVADVAWAWVAFDHYVRRPGWVRWAVQGFMGFVVFNAAVVFGSGEMRWVSLVVLAIPALWVLYAWWQTRPLSARNGVGESQFPPSN